MQIRNTEGVLSSTWYSKPTDTGLILNFHALAPRRYKKSVVSGFVHRIVRACSNWLNVHSSLEKAKRVLEQNQYPPVFYNPIIEQTLTTIYEQTHCVKAPENTTPVPTADGDEMTPKEKQVRKKLLFIQYRGKCTEQYASDLHKANAPCTLVMTLRKLSTTLPSLKPKMEKNLRSGTVYSIKCPRCKSCYVGQTGRHILTRFKEHQLRPQAVRNHIRECGVSISMDDVQLLKASSRGEEHLLTLEALFIEETKPTINTKDEYKQRQLTIKLF